MIRRLRVLWRFPAAVAALVLMGAAVHSLLLIPLKWRRGPMFRARSVCSKAFMWILDVRPRLVEPEGGLPAEHGGYLLVANHASFLDILVLAGAFETSFLSKASVRHWPILGSSLYVMGSLFLERESPEARFAILTELGDHIGPGEIITVFPQGTTSHLEPWQPFQRGIFKVLDFNPRLSLLPITLRYGDMEEIVWRDEGFLENFVKIAGRSHVDVEILVHPPVSSAEARGVRVRALTDRIEAQIKGPLLDGAAAAAASPSTAPA